MCCLDKIFQVNLNVDIFGNPAFIRPNGLFAGKLWIKKLEGKGTTKHKEPISDEDLLAHLTQPSCKKLYSLT